ncbi:hypothetical protein D3C85_1902850 [compost metagenome]
MRLLQRFHLDWYVVEVPEHPLVVKRFGAKVELQHLEGFSVHLLRLVRIHAQRLELVR